MIFSPLVVVLITAVTIFPSEGVSFTVLIFRFDILMAFFKIFWRCRILGHGLAHGLNIQELVHKSKQFFFPYRMFGSIPRKTQKKTTDA